MSVKLEIAVSPDLPAGIHVPDAADCQHWAQPAVPGNGDCVASLQIVTAGEMQQLNREYRQRDKPTNVLSFPMALPQEVGLNLLGDLALCAQVIADEARQQGKSVDAHWAHMIVHGLLHLQGYDHIDEKDARQMEAMEIRILQQLGFDNPYQNDF